MERLHQRLQLPRPATPAPACSSAARRRTPTAAHAAGSAPQQQHQQASAAEPLAAALVLEPPPQLVLEPAAAEHEPTRSHQRRRRRCAVHDHHGQLVPYHTAWQWQRDIVSRMTSLPSQQQQEQQHEHPARDSVIILQHPPIYTLGAGSTEANLLFPQRHQQEGAGGSSQQEGLGRVGGGAAADAAAHGSTSSSGIPVVRTERGGEVTYHGPGQLVMYPIVDLAHHTKDLHWYMRQLEEVVIRALWEVSGIEGRRVEGLTGVWVGDEKVAAIGVRAKKWVTFHGLALNVCPDLGPFQDIVPCGIRDRGVTSVQRVLGLPCGVHPLQMADDGSSGWGEAEQEEGVLAQRQELLDEYSFALLDAFASVFEVQLEFREA